MPDFRCWLWPAGDSKNAFTSSRSNEGLKLQFDPRNLLGVSTPTPPLTAAKCLLSAFVLDATGVCIFSLWSSTLDSFWFDGVFESADKFVLLFAPILVVLSVLLSSLSDGLASRFTCADVEGADPSSSTSCLWFSFESTLVLFNALLGALGSSGCLNSTTSSLLWSLVAFVAGDVLGCAGGDVVPCISNGKLLSGCFLPVLAHSSNHLKIEIKDY